MSHPFLFFIFFSLINVAHDSIPESSSFTKRKLDLKWQSTMIAKISTLAFNDS
jgi:hypothetical protein